MSRHLAGSAIAQGPNVGRIDKWSEWKPTSRRCLWLLLSGASNPPSGSAISDRRTMDCHGTRGCSFLSSVTRDLANMEAAVKAELFNTVKDLYLTRDVALGYIKSLFETCRRQGVKPMLYYTGHGEKGTGNWCFIDGQIGIKTILDMRPKGTHYPMIFSETCYSGHWANFCLEMNIDGFHCLAACPEYSKAIDNEDGGGDLTLFMTGRITRPSTEPLYSGGNRQDFPITTGYDSVDYTEFVLSHLVHSENIVISQSFHDGCVSVIFAPSKSHNPRPFVSCASRSDHDSFIELANKKRNLKGGKSKQISSLACDEKLGFGVFFMTNYGSAQKILTDMSDIEKEMKDGFKITACAAWGSTFYVIMTKGTREYKGRQRWFTANSWDEAEKLIQKNQEKKRVVTGICYSTGQKTYLVVVMETSQDQIYKKFCDVAALDKWVNKQYKEGFHPTIIFKDPTDNNSLVVMVKDVRMVPYICKYDCKVSFAVPKPRYLAAGLAEENSFEHFWMSDR